MYIYIYIFTRFSPRMVQRSGGKRRSSKTVIPLLPFTGSTTTGPNTAAVPCQRRHTGKATNMTPSISQSLFHFLLNDLEYQWKYRRSIKMQIAAGTTQTMNVLWLKLRVPIHAELLIFCTTKPSNVSPPHISWMSDASIPILRTEYLMGLSEIPRISRSRKTCSPWTLPSNRSPLPLFWDKSISYYGVKYRHSLFAISWEIIPMFYIPIK